MAGDDVVMLVSPTDVEENAHSAQTTALPGRCMSSAPGQAASGEHPSLSVLDQGDLIDNHPLRTAA